jgi:hypothetical protein
VGQFDFSFGRTAVAVNGTLTESEKQGKGQIAERPVIGAS